jgi:hypothetical protein
MTHATPLRYELLNLGGGHVDGQPPEHIEDNEAARLVNWIPFGSKLRRREGMAQITTAPHPERITSLFPYKREVGEWLLLAGTQTKVAKLVGRVLVDITVADGGVYGSCLDPWHFRQYQDVVYAARRGTGTLKRITADTIQDAGIAEPLTAPVLSDGGVGQVEAGTYYGVVTFFNTNTGAEGNPSPVSNALVLGPGRSRTWSAIPVSTNGQVNARRLYVTLPNQTGEYYLAATILDNTTTVFTEDTSQAELGRAASFENDLPPANIELLEKWRERLWISDGKDVFFSNIIAGQANPEGFSVFNILPFATNDGHRVRALHAHGAQLIVAKTNAIFFVTPVGTGGFGVEMLTDSHGCVAPFSMVSAERHLFWYSGLNVYRSDGVNAVAISNVKVRAALDAVPEEMREKVVGAVVPRLSLLLLTMSQGTERAELILAYNYKTDVWATLELANTESTVISPEIDICHGCPPPEAPTPSPKGFAFLGDFFDANLGQVLYGSLYDGHVYQFLIGDRDIAVNIPCRYLGKSLGLDQTGLLKGLRRASVLCSRASESITFNLYNDGATVAAASRTVSLDHSRDWKRFSLSTMGKLAATLQLEIVYAGRAAIDLEGLILEAMGFKRSGRVY